MRLQFTGGFESSGRKSLRDLSNTSPAEVSLGTLMKLTSVLEESGDTYGVQSINMVAW